jgi:hypothetical protein
VAVADDPLWSPEVETLARAICADVADGAGGPSAELIYLARRVAEAEVDVVRVRRARHDMMARALDNPRYRSPRHLRRQIAMLIGVGNLLMRGIAVPGDMAKAALPRPKGAVKFALVITDLAGELAKFERYERRALSRRKAAVREFDAARAGRGTAILIELPAIGRAPDEEARQRAARALARRRNKATEAPPPAAQNKATADPPSPPKSKIPPPPWGDRPMSQVSYREAGSYICQLLDIDWPLRLDRARDGPAQTPDRIGGEESDGGSAPEQSS